MIFKLILCAIFVFVVECTNFTCPKPFGNYAHSFNCKDYYTCKENIPILRGCQRRKLFDEKKRVCLDLLKVDCGTRIYNPYSAQDNEAVTEVSVPANAIFITELKPTPVKYSSNSSDFQKRWKENACEIHQENTTTTVTAVANVPIITKTSYISTITVTGTITDDITRLVTVTEAEYFTTTVTPTIGKA